MRGPAARNKGIALFPRAGRRPPPRAVPLRRRDHRPDHPRRAATAGRTPVPLPRPDRGWELIQVGNCGSPIETDAGWLVLTHGVGPDAAVRHRRAAARPATTRSGSSPSCPARCSHPDETERDGYVPNVVYSCGGLAARRHALAAVRRQRRPGRLRQHPPRRPHRRDAVGPADPPHSNEQSAHQPPTRSQAGNLGDDCRSGSRRRVHTLSRRTGAAHGREIGASAYFRQ